MSVDIWAQQTANKKRIPRKNNPLISILHEIANTILRMTRGMQRLDRDAFSDLERFPMLRRFGYRCAALSADDGELAELFELFS